MSENVLVKLYFVRSGGGTGRLLGYGALVDSQLVLVRPPLAKVFAANPKLLPMRAVLAHTRADSVSAEIVDVAKGQVYSSDDGQEPLVGLRLKLPTSLPPDELDLTDVTDGDQLAQRYRTHLAGLPAVQSSPAALAGPERGLWCWLFSSLC